ncbi:hypothetical protein OF83DRAFT_1052597 [Amylostereum chailletii]|nr:hypothetical protein OF83DRAFT_1052597 [Amylostereum chailletii]
MSRTSTSGNDFDIWKFVSCAKCRLPYETDGSGPPMVPFWLTECGHIICNNHLNADQSCPGCGLQQVQMTPLQRELPPPLSDWFLSLPHVLDTIANSVKFQQEMLASLVIFYKNKSAHQRGVIERVKGEIGELKTLRKANAQLMAENEQLRQTLEYGHGQSASSVNSNGKRRMTDAYRHGPSSTFSSPRSVTTPLGPNRLTLPRDHHQPAMGQRPNDDTNVRLSGAPGFHQPTERPGSSRFAQ